MAVEREIRIRFDGSARGFARAAKRAEKALADFEQRAQRSQDAFGKAGGRSAIAFASQVQLVWTRAAARLFGPAGAITALLAPTVVATGISLGAAMAGAMTGAVTGGVVAAGIALSVRDPRIRAAFADLGGDMLAELTAAGSAFVEPVMRSIQQVRSFFNSVDWRGMFASASRYVEPLVDGMLGLARNVIPGIRRALDRAAPIVAAIRRGLPAIGRAISDALDSMSKNGANAAVALEWVFRAVAAIVRGTGAFLGWCADAYDWLLKIAWGAAEVANRFVGWMPIIGPAVRDAAASAADMNAAIERAKKAGDDWRGGTVELTAAQRLNLDAQEALWKRTLALNGSMEEAINAAGSLSEAFELLNGAALDAREAEAAYEEAIDEARAAIDKKVKSINLGTERGRRYDELLRNQVTTTAQYAQAVYDQTAATEGVAAAQQAATRIYEEGRQQLIETARQMGLSETAAIAYADEVMKIPTSWSTTVEANTSGARSAVKSYIEWLKGLDPVVRTRMVVEQRSARGGHREFSAGGPVRGPGPRGRDSVPAMLAPGEHVWTHREVQAAGGHAAVERMRKAVLAGVRTIPSPVATASGRPGIVVEHLEVKAYSDRFSLRQVSDDLAVYGVR